jgi:sugar O-acyltransferase (sialic acid O-acetyltransferase NeuD family)
MVKKVIIIGSSGHSKVIIDIFEKEGKYEVVGLLTESKETGGGVLGYMVIREDNDLPDLIVKYPNCAVFIAIGDNWVRKLVRDKIVDLIPNIEFASTIHPSAQIGKNVEIGKGVAIMAGAIINSGTIIEDFTIINTKASIDHDSKMLNFSSLAPNVTTGGNVTVGEFSLISIGAIIKERVFIGNHVIIGAGALQLKNCGDNLIMYGRPAKVIRRREVGEKYF